MTLSKARKIADGDLANTNCQVLSDAFDVLRASAGRAHVNRIQDHIRATRLWNVADYAA